MSAGPLRPALEALALRLNLRVDFAGGVYGDAALAAHLKALDVVVNPSLRAWSETFCIANAEAMASGAGAVSFGVGGVGEYFRPLADFGVSGGGPDSHADGPADGHGNGHGNGVLARAASAEALADGVLRLLANATLRRETSRHARRTVQGGAAEESFKAWSVLFLWLHPTSCVSLRSDLSN